MAAIERACARSGGASKEADPRENGGIVSPMEHYNITEFLRGQSSKILTAMANEDKTAYIQKNGKPLVVAMSNSRYERLVKKGININEY